MTRLLLPILAAAFLGGCANVSPIEVGAIPDDYRTRHPIVVSEGEVVMELPVTAHERKLTYEGQRRVAEFAGDFRHAQAAAVRVMVPTGAYNEEAARSTAGDVVATLRARGVSHERIIVTPYPANAVAGPVPIRLAYSTLRASAGPCGRWPDDIGNSYENRNYFNFGCASQANLAAQIADPRDLLSPRGRSEIDAARRTTSLERFRAGGDPSSPRRQSEVNY